MVLLMAVPAATVVLVSVLLLVRKKTKLQEVKVK